MGSTVQGDIGVRIGLSEEELNRGIARVSGALNDLAKTVEQLGKRIDQVMAQAAGETQKTAKATKELAQEEKAAAEAADRHAAAQKRLADEQKKTTQTTRDQKKALDELRQGIAQVTAVSTAAAVAVAAAAKVGIDAHKQQTQALSGLANAAERMGESVQAANEVAKELASDGLANVMNISRALQAYLVSGFSLEEAKELVQISKDAAVYNRQAGLSIGEAIERMAEGIRMGSSVLSDAAGISKNLTTILKEMGYSEQDLQRVQSDAAVRQALLNGLRREGAIFAGNAAKAAQEYAGSEAAAANAAFQAKAALGGALAPAIQQVLDAVTPLLSNLATWIELNPELARTIVMVTGAVTSLVAVMGSLALLLPGLKTAFAALTSPVGLVVAGLGALAGVLAGVAASQAAARAEAERNAQKTVELADQYERLQRVLSSTTAEEEEKTKAQEELRRVIAELGDLMPEIVTKWDEEGRAIELNTQKLDENTEAVKRNLKAKADATLQTTIAEYQALKSQEAVLEGLWTDSRERQRAALQALGDPRFLQQFDDALMAARLGPEYQASAAQAMDQIIEMAKAQAERELALLRRDIAIKGGELNKLAQAAAGGAGDVGAGVPRTGPTSPGGQEAGKMSAALAAALEDLEDLQALERTPENLRRQLAMVRQILDEHGAELEKLGRKRDFERTANIVLPQQIADAVDQATGQEFRRALEQLNADVKLLELTPDQIRERLRAINDQFADYLAAHPDQGLQMELKLKDATDAEIREPLERWQREFRQNEQLGLYSGAGGQELRLRALREGLGLALGAGDEDAYFDIAGQILKAEAALNQANFEARFDRIKDARERAFAGAAEELARLERELIDAETAGNTQRAAEIEQTMLNLVRPALEAQKAALEELLESITGTDEQAAKQRAQVEAELNRVKQELYDQDTEAHRIATEARVAAEREAAQKMTQALQGIREVLRIAQKQDLDDIQKRQQTEEKAAQRRIERLREEKEAAEEAQQARIRGLQDELAALERLWAAEDRRNRLADLRAQLAEVMADTSYQWVNPETGQVEWTYDRARARELEKQIEEAERDEERARIRERLQDQIQAECDRLDTIRRSYDEEIRYEQDRLARMRETHQEELQERQKHWEALLSLDDEQLTALVEQTDLKMGDGEDGWYGVLAKWLTKAVEIAQSKTSNIVSALQSIVEAAQEARSALNSFGGGSSSGGGAMTGTFKAFAHGGVADPSNPVFGVFGERVREYLVPVDYLGELASRLAALLEPRLAIPAVPSLPASLGAATSATSLVVSPGAVSPGAVQINITGVTDPQATATAVRTTVKQAEQGLLEALIQAGRTRLRTG